MVGMHELIAKGNEARDIRNLISTALITRQDLIVKRLIAQYKSNTLTNEILWAGLGEIVGLNDYLKDLNNTVKRGQLAQEKEVNSGQSSS